MKLFNFGP